MILSFNQNKIFPTSYRTKMFLAAFSTSPSYSLHSISSAKKFSDFFKNKLVSLKFATVQGLNISFYRYSASIDTTSSHHLELAQAPHPHQQVGLVFWLCIYSRCSLS